MKVPEKTRVAIVSCASYEPAEVERAVGQALQFCGGIERFVKPDCRVLLKPNFVMAKSLDQAVTTHPEIIRAIGKLVKIHTSKISIGDSPGLTSALNVMRKTGVDKVADELGAQQIDFQQIHSVKDEHAQFHLELAGEIFEHDCLINLPKFKTHGQMLMTLAVKNLYGCIVGFRKVQWHMRAGTDWQHFARLLVDICRTVKPSFNLIDGVMAMEGEGPTAGTARALNVIIAGENPFAVDYAACLVAGIPPEELPTLKMARQLEIFGANEADIELLGAPVAQVAVKDFKRPGTYPIMFGFKFMRNMFRNTVTPRPLIEKKKCLRCGICVKGCPANAMTVSDECVVIDYKKCIRCFCCQEHCPHQAVRTGHGLLFRIFRRVFRLSGGRKA